MRRHAELSSIVALLVVGGTASFTFSPSDAHAQSINDSNLVLDLSPGLIAGSARVAAMGGAGAAASEGADGMVLNSASVGVWGPDGYTAAVGDLIFGQYGATRGSDISNNGLLTDDQRQMRALTLGVMMQTKAIGFGIYLANQKNTYRPDGSSRINTVSQLGQIFTTLSMNDNQFIVGGGVTFGGARLSADSERLFSEGAVGYEIGVLLKPEGSNVRLGGRFASRLKGNRSSDCITGACAGFNLPAAFEIPWRARAGLAFRVASQPWNEARTSAFRDEVAMTVAVDVEVTGPVDNGVDAEAFGAQTFLRSGDAITFMPRGGAEIEMVPGYFRLRGGAYLEPSRIDGVESRWHGTGGFEARILSYESQGGQQRLGIAVNVDVADEFTYLGASFGKWK